MGPPNHGKGARLARGNPSGQSGAKDAAHLLLRAELLWWAATSSVQEFVRKGIKSDGMPRSFSRISEQNTALCQEPLASTLSEGIQQHLDVKFGELLQRNLRYESVRPLDSAQGFRANSGHSNTFGE